MTMVWTGLATAALFLAQMTMGKQAPEKAESPVGSFYWAAVSNPTSDSVLVSIIAPRVDSAIRPLGILGPQEAARARLPYADPPLVLLYIALHQPQAGWFHAIPPDSIFHVSDSLSRPGGGPPALWDFYLDHQLRCDSLQAGESPRAHAFLCAGVP